MLSFNEIIQVLIENNAFLQNVQMTVISLDEVIMGLFRVNFELRKSHGKCSFRVYIKLIRNWLVYVNIRGRTVVTHHLTIKLRIM